MATPDLRSSIPVIHDVDVDSDLGDSSDYSRRVATVNLNSLLNRKDNGYEQTTEVDSTPCVTPCENQLNDDENSLRESSRLDRGLTSNEILDLVLSTMAGGGRPAGAAIQADDCILTDASIFLF